MTDLELLTITTTTTITSSAVVLAAAPFHSLLFSSHRRH
jgi:hypothetical protein